jgi:hypothetical protein
MVALDRYLADDTSDDPFRFEREMAIAIFDKQDPAALRALKQFLLNLSGPKAIETVLAEAVCGCAQGHPEAFAWLLAHRHLLEPELFLQQWMRRQVLTRLLRQGCVTGEAFGFEYQVEPPGLLLRLDDRSRELLLTHFSSGEVQLIGSLFAIEL